MADITKKLTFTRDWRVNGTEDEGGFPTHESREEVVRADMQYLHEETKNHINEKLWPAVQELADRQTVSFSHVPTIGANGNWQLWSEEQQKYVDSGVSAWQGNMDEALETVAKEAAEAVNLETLGAYSKEETLSDDTKTLYGLEKTAKPDDVLEKIHEYVAEKAAHMVGQNASETTGRDGSEFCDVTVEGSIGVDYSLGASVGDESGHMFTLTLSLDRLPDKARLLYLPGFSFTGDYKAPSSTRFYVPMDCEISLNGEGVATWFDAFADFSYVGYTVAFPFESPAVLCFGRPLRKGDKIVVSAVCRYAPGNIGFTASLTNLVATPENARYVEV